MTKQWDSTGCRCEACRQSERIADLLKQVEYWKAQAMRWADAMDRREISERVDFDQLPAA